MNTIQGLPCSNCAASHLREKCLREALENCRNSLHWLLRGGDFAAWLEGQEISMGASKECDDGEDAIDNADKILSQSPGHLKEGEK